MRTDWIEDIVSLLDAGGVAEAAHRRNITQPAFSRRLRTLEDVLGIDLVDRASRPSGPTRVLRDHADRFRRLADEQRALLATMRQAQAQGAPQLVVVCQHAITTSLGPRIVAAMRDAAGGSVRLRSANRDECDIVLYARGASISVTYRVEGEQSEGVPAFLQETVLAGERLLPVIGADHAKRAMWAFHQGRLTMIGYPSDVFLGTTLARHVTVDLARRCEIDVAAETALTPAAMQMARAGVGIAWVPGALAQEGIRAGDLVALAEELGAVEMQLVAHRWSSSDDPRIEAAWQALCGGVIKAGFP